MDTDEYFKKLNSIFDNLSDEEFERLLEECNFKYKKVNKEDIETLLSSKLWYNTDEVIKVFLKLKRVEELKKIQKSSKSVSDNSKVNSELKKIYSEFSEIITNA